MNGKGRKGNGRRGCHAVLAALAMSFANAIPSFAQSPNTGTIVVRVVDETDAVLPGAHVTVANVATGLERETQSGPNGVATVTALAAGSDYKVAVSLPGFQTRVRDAVLLRGGETATI